MLTDLKLKFHAGQVFITWKESGLLPEDTISVFAAAHPIDTLQSAQRIGHNIEQHSAGDWWNDPASFVRGAISRKETGFMSPWGVLPPGDGLFVHTITPANIHKSYYAVCVIRGSQCKDILCSKDSIPQSVSPIQPFFTGAGPGYPQNAALGRALYIHLHGRSAEPDDTSSNNVEYDNNYVAYGDSTMGWREGIAFKFKAELHPDFVFLRPVDRAYTGRPLLESHDPRDHVPAVNTFWYGYPDNINDPAPAAPGTVVNYTQNRLLFLTQWAKNFLGCDPNRIYLTGGSMGGTGALAFAYMFPQLVAAVQAIVPLTRYSEAGGGNIYRLDGFCRNEAKSLKTPEGILLTAHLDQIARLQTAEIDLPYVYMANARQDQSMPWENNPPFYTAALNDRQGLTAYWNDGGHDVLSAVPADVSGWFDSLRSFRLNQSFPVCILSDNKQYGDGGRENGDLTGWLNRGVQFRVIRDEDNAYELALRISHPDIVYPVKADITLRRLQKFDCTSPAQASFRGRRFSVHKDAKGLLTIHGLCFDEDCWYRIQLNV